MAASTLPNHHNRRNLLGLAAAGTAVAVGTLLANPSNALASTEDLRNHWKEACRSVELAAESDDRSVQRLANEHLDRIEGAIVSLSPVSKSVLLLKLELWESMIEVENPDCAEKIVQRVMSDLRRMAIA